MDDVLVIILMLIFTVVGAISQNKKKKAQQLSKAGKTPTKKNFWDELIAEDEEYPQPQTVIHEQPDTMSPIVEQQPVAEIKTKNTMSGGSLSDIMKSAEPIAITKPKVRQNRLQRKFSLRDAVVYSEILNRKYT